MKISFFETVRYRAPEALPPEVQFYVLTSQDRIVRGRMPALERTNERFARQLRTGFRGCAGEVGHTVVAADNDVIGITGQTGTVEPLAA